MAANLPPLPQPGLPIFPGFMARKPETFLMKATDTWSTKSSSTIYFATPTGQIGTPFVQMKEQKSKNLSFLTMDGREVMRIVKQKHPWSGKGTEYHGMRGDGQEVWHLKLRRGLTKTEYILTINERSAAGKMISVENKIMGQDKGILVNGTPVATMSKFEEWSHMSRQDIIHVAPGMDILLALAVNWIRTDKQEEDSKMVAAAV
ncbi:hypothetical protein IQ07DRAFT_589885 [Pyrenochaeta sp. DS3sAY3a]|nr:hypothetical protein IQ07DRAFT_589885 [Pyrenochaeta sp. DS3sAY3a]